MSKPRKFPQVTGRCFCGETRFRLEVPPLFCYSCHCPDCAKHTGSVFACFASIEADYITPLGKLPPKITKQPRPAGITRFAASCAKCGTNLWATGDVSAATSDVKIGVLDHPNLFEPDLHSFIENKIPWVTLPEGARTCEGPFDFRKEWPASSMRRYEAAVKRREERIANAKKAAAAARAAAAAEIASRAKDKDALEVADVEEADKTPTAQSPDLKENGKQDVNDDEDGVGDDDLLEDEEEFERRYRETEKALQERLEKLTAKLAEQKLEEDK
ncbi:hypothetical protein DM02DRAFT_644012 [Periconia macrospinosa]|uniref:CENP-V/GFA domain-containing protein n=1 Tax=Periconia macrospinosa TaxID=97972 RepID=A0A2V1DHV3_9PLEO|nr:hypothetical protein DM02DRAFT_644012 [Periconia macrospinosa]